MIVSNLYAKSVWGTDQIVLRVIIRLGFVGFRAEVAGTRVLRKAGPKRTGPASTTD